MFLAFVTAAFAQVRPYIGYAYPAGGQQGTIFQVKVGGQQLDDVSEIYVSGTGVTAKVVEYYRRMNPQEMQLLNEQKRELKKPGGRKSHQEMLVRIDKRQTEYVQQPACASISSLVFAEIRIATNAEPGPREIRLATTKGISNPLVFHVGQLPEHTRKSMITATIQVLGKEASALRKRPPEEAEDGISIPRTLNGQIASGEVNRYRFAAHGGQRLVISTQGRSLIPFIADAVPGWFQPLINVYDAKGKELAFADDYRFRPDPVLLFDVPKDGDYVLAITDAIYRGREDFVYRVSIGELPFVTGMFPLGTKVGASFTPKLQGWNLQDTALKLPTEAAAPAIVSIIPTRKEIVNPMPFALDALPDKLESEPNNATTSAQSVKLPIIINGRIEKPGDSDVFQFTGKSNDTIVAEVLARRLDSPLDSIIKLTDGAGKMIAFSDDREDLGAGVNTHHADSWFMAKLPVDGTYFVHISDTARKGGEEYGYRLRISAPQPDFELRVAPSSIAMRTNSSAGVTVYAQRKDGLDRTITLSLTNAPPGFFADPVKMAEGQISARLTIRGPKTPTTTPVNLTIIGSAAVGEKQIVREAMPTEDRMQAFLWRQLVPANEFKALVFDPGYELPLKRPLPNRPPPSPTTNAVVAVTTNAPAGTNTVATAKKFTKNQVARRIRELKMLFEEGLLTDPFYNEKLDECEAMQ